MGALAVGYAVEVVLIVAVTVGLAVWLRRRTKVGYGLVGVGALVMLGSQVVHFPLNWGLGHVLPPGALWVAAAALGLSAGVCEELARYVVIRWWRKDVRHTEPALMLGMGHGGIEALFVAVLGGIMFVNLVVLQRNPEALLAGLSPEQQLAAAAQIEALSTIPVAAPLVGALERVLVLPFHLAATLMVTKAVAARRPMWLVGAIAFHALLDGPMSYINWTVGPVAAELWIAMFCVISLGVLWVLGRRLRRPVVEEERVEPRGAPIELNDASKTYGGTVRALRGASLVIEKGTRTCLLGPNGAGKTTAIRLVTGGLAPSGGEAWLFGTASGDDEFVAAQRRLGVVPQQPGMYDDLTVGTWLELVRDLYEAGDVSAVAAELGLEELVDRPMAKLSGGQKRRVAIASAVLASPELLILDEPSAGLDPIASREVLDYLEALAPSQTILLCTHDLEEAEALCDRVVVMRDGKVLVHEAIADLRARLTPQIALRVSSDMAEASALLEGSHEDDGELYVTVEDPEKDAPALLRRLLEQGVDVVECRVVRASLEDLFLDIVGSAVDDEEDEDEESVAPEPVPPPIPLTDLWGKATRRLMAKEWKQIRASGGAFWTSLLMPFFFLLVIPQSLIGSVVAIGDETADTEDLPDFGALGEMADDPARLVIALVPLFITVAALAAPTALITHSIVHERETRTLELLVSLPVRVQQVVAAKLITVMLFQSVLCGVFTVAIGTELMVLGLATLADIAGLLVMLVGVLAFATVMALWVALVSKDFRTANNLAGVVIAPAMFLVMIISTLVPGVGRPLVIALVFASLAFLMGRIALRSATFEKLVS